MFTTDNFPNEYLFQLFDIDTPAFRSSDPKSPHKPIQKLKIGKKTYEAFTVYRKSSKIEKSDSQLANLFYQIFASSSLFSPTPSEYILEQSKVRKDKNHYGSGTIRDIGYY